MGERIIGLIRPMGPILGAFAVCRPANLLTTNTTPNTGQRLPIYGEL
jgi:hypothetical protein